MPSSTTSSTIDAACLGPREEVWDTPPDAAPVRWTPDQVAARLVEAFRVLARLPRNAGPRAAGNHWVRHSVEWADRLAQAELPEGERRDRERRRNDALAFRPTGAEIARMDEALEWLRALRGHDAELATIVALWAFRAARRRSVRAICREMGWKPPTFYYQRGRALDHLVARLNAGGCVSGKLDFVRNRKRRTMMAPLSLPESDVRAFAGAENEYFYHPFAIMLHIWGRFFRSFLGCSNFWIGLADSKSPKVLLRSLGLMFRRGGRWPPGAPVYLAASL